MKCNVLYNVVYNCSKLNGVSNKWLKFTNQAISTSEGKWRPCLSAIQVLLIVFKAARTKADCVCICVLHLCS